MSSKKKFLLYSGAIALLGFLCRLTVGFQLLHADRAVSEPLKTTDMATYLSLSGEILKGNFPAEFDYQPFYYTVFLPLVRLLTGGSVEGIIFFQALAGAFAAFLAGTIAMKLSGKIAGYSAVILASFSSILIVYTPFALLETLQSLLVTLLLALTIESWKRKKLWLWFVTGLVLSFCILTRGNTWVFLPVLFAAAWYSCQTSGEKKRTAFALAALMILLGAILPQIPYAIRNSCARGMLCGPSTAGGKVLALGNTPEAPAGGLMYPETYELWMSTEKEISIPRRILAWFKEEPMAVLELQFRKVLLFMDAREIPNNINPDEVMKKSALMSTIPFFSTGMILVLAFAGFLLSFKRSAVGHDKLFVSMLFMVFYVFSIAAFYVLARFRVPIVPLLCTSAGIGVYHIRCSLRKTEDRRRRGFIVGIILLLSYFLIYSGFQIYTGNYAPGLLRRFRPHGVDVPTREGGRLIYDHGPALEGGWKTEHRSMLIKKFNPVTEIKEGEKVQVDIYIFRGEGRAFVILNGLVQDLSLVPPMRTLKVTSTVPWPKDGIFRVEFEGAVDCMIDWNRNYGRTFLGDGAPLDKGELVIDLRTLPAEK